MSRDFSNAIGRRNAIAQLGALTALVGMGGTAHAFQGSAGAEIARQITRIDALTGALRGQVITVDDWRAGLEELVARIPVQDVMTAINFDTLAAKAGFAALGVSTLRVDFGGGIPQPVHCIAKVFGVDTGRSIIPHGHGNMVSAHLPLTGRFRLRQYDQIARDDAALTVRPSVDRRIEAGDLSSIGEDADNVHWFIAEEPSHTFDMIVTGLNTAQNPAHEIFNLDMESATAAGDGLLRVPRLSVEKALRKYG